MKYTSLKKKGEKILTIPLLDGGINFSASNRKIADNQLVYSKNMFFESGFLKTRPGIYSENKSILDVSDFNFANHIDYRITDTKVFINGEYKKIAVCDIDYGYSNFIYAMFLLGSDASQLPIGNIYFNRLDDSTFFKPFNITFYCGASKNGSGIFALVSLQNIHNSQQKEYHIYELDKTLKVWNMSYQYYVPTVFINGRGNAYEMAAQNNYVLQSKPTNLEALNMLDGRFYAYYSSDGFSNSFKLPFSNISASSVVCRIYYSLKDYSEWVIYEGETNAKTTFNNTEVTMHIDRQKGLVYFMSAQGDYSIPRMSVYKENNIRILAKKDIEGGFENIVSSTISKDVGFGYIFAGGNKSNELYYCDFERPLYFPVITENYVGASDEPINSLAVSGEKIFIFKSSSIHFGTFKKGEILNNTSLLTDNASIFNTPKKIDIQCITNKSGPLKKQTVDIFNNQPIWQGKDSGIYTVSSSGKIKNISQDFKEFLKINFSADEVYAQILNEQYFLCYNNKIVLINLESEKPTIYFWEFPDEVKIIGLVSSSERIAFVCKNLQTNIAYCASLKGSIDICVSGLNKSENVYKIKSYIKTKAFDLNSGYRKRRINRLILKMSKIGNCKISIGDDNNFVEFNLKDADIPLNRQEIDIITNLYGVGSASLSISSDKVINFESADIYYI